MRDLNDSHLCVSRWINEANRGPRLATQPENRPRRNQVAPVCHFYASDGSRQTADCECRRQPTPATGYAGDRAHPPSRVRRVGSRHGPARQGRGSPRSPHPRRSAAAAQRVGRGECCRDRPRWGARDRDLERRCRQRPRVRRRAAPHARADARRGRCDRRRRRPARHGRHGGRLRRRARGRCGDGARSARGRCGRAQHGRSAGRRRRPAPDRALRRQDRRRAGRRRRDRHPARAQRPD